MTQEIKIYLDTLTGVQKDNLLALREIILATDEGIKEAIKWGSICFYKEKNICGFKVAKNHITLVFFEGGSLNDKFHLLSGTGAKARTLKYDGSQQLNAEGIKVLMLQAIGC